MTNLASAALPGASLNIRAYVCIGDDYQGAKYNGNKAGSEAGQASQEGVW